MSVVTVESLIEEENRLLKAALWAMPISALEAVLNDPFVVTTAKEAIKSEIARRRCWEPRLTA